MDKQYLDLTIKDTDTDTTKLRRQVAIKTIINREDYIEIISGEKDSLIEERITIFKTKGLKISIE